jgi:hypothetical protein
MYKIILVLLISLIVNCATSNAGIATSNIPIVSKKYKVIAPVTKVESWVAFDIGILAKSFQKPPIETMVTNILAQNNADALINIRYWQDRSILLFITIHRIGLTAEAVKFEEEEINANPKKTR